MAGNPFAVRVGAESRVRKVRREGCARHAEVLHEAPMELLRIAVDDALRILSKNLHLPPVAVRGEVAFEAVLIAALLAAHLTVPSQLAEALGLDAIANLHSNPPSRICALELHVASQAHASRSCVQNLQVGLAVAPSGPQMSATHADLQQTFKGRCT